MCPTGLVNILHNKDNDSGNDNNANNDDNIYIHNHFSTELD